ncbi:serine/threonine protein kinase [Pseudonocardia hierapolitana]|uniref:Serine/threonine protein kinase n=1 Tax=Pseudonocardia hierapolitana TaxID=1128676 RepID=A0A561T5P6_9PSEU|nr:serine/threonine-protein kinase [Pseudonocardia hierapolitana]TWF82432.1 serine/threonine protein kinase [Pseudonocardia hierapolitana]
MTIMPKVHAAAAVQALHPTDPHRIGPYQVLGVLGAGGMGQVYLAAGPSGLVAVKVVHPALAPDRQFRTRFAREVEAGRRVRSPWTAAVVDADPDASTPWLATEYVPGVPLSQAIATTGPLPPPTVAALAAHLARALAAIHEADLVHRDVKPGNVLLAADRPKMIDFGISSALDGTRMTSTGMAVGTPAFMSPEQADGAELTTASDLFSLGSVLVWAATGTGPFGEGSPVTLLRRILTAEPALGALTGPVRDLVAECLHRDPAARPTAAQLAERLPPAPVGTGWLPSGVAALVTAPATNPGPMTPPPPPARGVSRRGLLAGLGAVLGTAALGGVGATAAGLFRTGPGPATGAPAGPTRTATPRWTYPTGGPLTCMVAGDGVVHAAGADAVAHAIDVRTGQARWTYSLRGGGSSHPPAVVDGAVYIDDDRMTVYALDATGALRWEERGRLIAAGAGTVLAATTEDARNHVTGYDAATGRVRWKSVVDGAPWEGFALDTPGAAADGRAHVGLKHALRTLDAVTGTTLWEQPLPDLDTVTVAGPIVYGTGGSPTAHSTLVAFDAATGRELWRRTVEDRYGRIAVHDDTVYVDGGNGVGLSALDAQTGEPRWELGRGTSYSRAMYGTAPVVAGDTCYIGGIRVGRLDPTPAFTLFAHATDTGEERFTIDLALDTGYTASIALVGDTLVLGSERFDATSGAIVGIA